MKLTRHKIKLYAISFMLLGVVASPIIASAATDDDDTIVEVIIDSMISVVSDAKVTINITPTPSGVYSSGSGIVTVDTNDSAGYTLTLADNDADTKLNSAGNNFTAHTGTLISPTTLTAGTWGWAVANLGGFDASYSAVNSVTPAGKWAGIKASGSGGDVIASSVAPITNAVTTVWFAAAADASQAPGTYQDTVTFSGTTN